jgi:hypothetical protein
VTGARAFAAVDWADATAPVAGAEGPAAAGVEGCTGADDGWAVVAVAEDDAWLAGWAPTALAEEVVAGGPDGAGGGVD